MRSILATHFAIGASRREVDLAERLARFTMAFVDGALIDSQIDPEGTRIPDLFADLAVALQATVAAHKERR